jgi:subtilisin family serine protease
MVAVQALLSAVIAVLALPVAALVAPLATNTYLIKLNPDTDIDGAFPQIPGEPVKRIAIGDEYKLLVVDLPEATVPAVEALPFVEYVEQDQEGRGSAIASQPNSPYGLSRISARRPGFPDYVFDDSLGVNTVSYILDSGIETSHPEFEGRAFWGTNIIGGPNFDCSGHGTHVAGTVGSRTFGVAKRTTLVAVKVLDCDTVGTASSFIDGIRWAFNDAQNRRLIGRSVANLSFGGPLLRALNDAANAAQQNGLFMSVAAGNEGHDARNNSPASANLVCTVGATDRDDARAHFSNFGPIVDIFAPGVDILSTWIRGGTNVISGTSMAAPHITGLAAYLIALEGVSPLRVCDRIRELATRGVIPNAAGSPNLVAYNGIGR